MQGDMQRNSWVYVSPAEETMKDLRAYICLIYLRNSKEPYVWSRVSKRERSDDEMGVERGRRLCGASRSQRASSSAWKHPRAHHQTTVSSCNSKILRKALSRRRVLMELSGFNIPCPWILTISCDIIIIPILWLGNWLRDDKFLIQHGTTYTCQFGSEFINQNFFSKLFKHHCFVTWKHELRPMHFLEMLLQINKYHGPLSPNPALAHRGEWRSS